MHACRWSKNPKITQQQQQQHYELILRLPLIPIAQVHSAGGLFSLKKGRLNLKSITNAQQVELTERRRCAVVQYVQQAFLARVSTLRVVGWDPVLKNNGEDRFRRSA